MSTSNVVSANLPSTFTLSAVAPSPKLEPNVVPDVAMDVVSDDEGTGSLVLGYPEEDAGFSSEQVCPLLPSPTHLELTKKARRQISKNAWSLTSTSDDDRLVKPRLRLSLTYANRSSKPQLYSLYGRLPLIP